MFGKFLWMDELCCVLGEVGISVFVFVVEVVLDW